MDAEDQSLQLFAYTREERDVFPYIDQYMLYAETCWPLDNESQQRKQAFMLAGLFLTYRACNHSGLGMSTEEPAFPDETIHCRRLRSFASHGGRISSTQDYLRQIGYGPLTRLWMAPGSFLIRYVRRNRVA